MAARPDDPTLDTERARAAIETACRDLQPATVIHLGRGWDHDVYLANEFWVFLFPRNEPAARALKLEEGLLPWLAPKLPLPVPEPACVGVLPETGWPIARHTLIPGTTICDTDLDAAARARLAEPLAHFVRALHAIPLADAPVKLGGDPFGRFDVARRAPRALEFFAGWRKSGLLDAGTIARLTRLVETPASSPPDDALVIVHADIHPRNVLIDSQGGLSGVIDWVDMHAGRRVLDYGGAFEILPASAREVFCNALGNVDDTSIRWARWRAVEHMTWAYSGAIERGDKRFARSCRQALIELSEN